MKKDGYLWPEHLNVGVLPPKGGLLTPDVARKWTAVLAQEIGMNINLVYAPDKPTKFKWLQLGLSDVADGSGEELGDMFMGLLRYGNRDSGPFPARIVWAFSKYDSGFMVRGDSRIKTVYDLKPGVRVVDTRPYLTSQRQLEGLLAWAGIDDLEKDVNWVPAHNTEEKIQLIVDGKADIASAIPSAPSTWEAERKPHGLRWLELNPNKDPEGYERFHEKFIITFGKMFRGVPSSLGIWSTVGADHFTARADLDAGLVYHLAKWFNENHPRLKDLHPWLTQTTLQNLMEQLDTTPIPCHDGLIKYLNELKLWTPEHEKRHKENVALVDRYREAWQQALWQADDKAVVVSVDNPEWLKLWENYKREHRLPVLDFLPSLGKGQPLD